MHPESGDATPLHQFASRDAVHRQPRRNGAHSDQRAVAALMIQVLAEIQLCFDNVADPQPSGGVICIVDTHREPCPDVVETRQGDGARFAAMDDFRDAVVIDD